MSKGVFWIIAILGLVIVGFLISKIFKKPSYRYYGPRYMNQPRKDMISNSINYHSQRPVRIQQIYDAGAGYGTISGQ